MGYAGGNLIAEALENAALVCNSEVDMMFDAAGKNEKVPDLIIQGIQ